LLVLWVCFVDRCLSFFCLPLYCLSFFDLHIMITTLVSSNSSISKYTMTYMPSGQYHLKTHMWKQNYSVFYIIWQDGFVLFSFYCDVFPKVLLGMTFTRSILFVCLIHILSIFDHSSICHLVNITWKPICGNRIILCFTSG
jgi:hypothetical protein